MHNKTLAKGIIIINALATISFAQPAAQLQDGDKTYKTVNIGTQTWMAENMNYEAEGSKCYDNNPDNCAKYGRLYTWQTAKKVCPKGWHLPSNYEWDKLYRFADGNAGTDSAILTTISFLYSLLQKKQNKRLKMKTDLLQLCSPPLEYYKQRKPQPQAKNKQLTKCRSI